MLYRLGTAFLLGALGGWVAGLLRTPRSRPRATLGAVPGTDPRTSTARARPPRPQTRPQPSGQERA